MNNTTTSNDTLDDFDDDGYANCGPLVVSSLTERWLKTSACIVVLIVSVLTNTFIIFIVNKKERIKTVTNCLVANMACSDLLIGLINMPNMIKEEVTDSHALPFGGFAGSFLCKTLVLSQDVSTFCSILSLVAIAVERYLAIFVPFKKYITRDNVKYVIISCWVLSLMVASPLLYANKGYLEDGKYYCAEDWSPLNTMTAASTYTLCTFVLLYALPLCSICYMYSAVVHRLWKQCVPGDQRTPQSRKKRSQAKKRVLKMLIAIVLAFAICWLPYHTYFFLDSFYAPYKDCGPPLKLYFISRFVAYANSAVSPCIFILFDKGVGRYISNKINPCCEGLTKNKDIRIHVKKSVLYSSNSEPEPTQNNGVVKLQAYKTYSNRDTFNGNGVNVEQEQLELHFARSQAPDLIAGHTNAAFGNRNYLSPRKEKRTVSFAL